MLCCLADETTYSEDDGWEFITLADQVSQYVRVHACVPDIHISAKLFDFVPLVITSRKVDF